MKITIKRVTNFQTYESNIIYLRFTHMIYFQILCKMRSLPAATLFRWTFNNSVQSNQIVTNKPENNLQTKKKHEKYPYYHSTLKYQAKTEKDFGEVRCFASNELGESDSPCIFTLIPAGKLLSSSGVYK